MSAKQLEENAARARHSQRTAELSAIIKPLRTAQYEVDHDWRTFHSALANYGQCIDGLQRITAVQAFIEGRVRPFGLSSDELDGSSFSMRGSRYRFRVAVHDFQNRHDLLQHYLDLNAGGTPHAEEEIARVRRLRDTAKECISHATN